MMGLREVVAALFCPLMLLVPLLNAYYTNTSHFQFPISAHLGTLAIYFVVASLLIWLLQYPRKTRPYVTSGLVVVGSFLWIESTFLVGDFGFFDGGSIAWSSYVTRAWFELALLLMLGFVAFRARTWLLTNTTYICVLLAALTAAPYLLATGTQQASVENAKPGYVFTEQGIVDFSSRQNVFIFVVDTLQADVLGHLVKQESRWEDLFAGFTYFPNSLSSFPKTYASVPTILTGQAYDNSQPLSRYLNDAYLSSSLPKVLMENGFDVRIFPYAAQPLIAHPELANNVVSVRDGQLATHVQQAEFAQLLSLALFRVAPIPGKEWVYNDGALRFTPAPGAIETCEPEENYARGNNHPDLALLDRFDACASATLQVPGFRFFHLSGAHHPFVLNDKLEHHKPARLTRPAYFEHTKGALAVLEKIFEHLKKLGIYEDALIVVVGDHGAGELPVGVDGSGLEVPPLQGDYEQPITPVVSTANLIAGAIPAMLVKRAGSDASLSLSHAPVQLSDVYATVLQELGFSTGARPSMFDIDVNEPRERLHRYYQFGGWSIDYILPMMEFVVTGTAGTRRPGA
jgi:hypothetical protein